MQLLKVPGEWDGGANSVRDSFRVLRIQAEVRVGKRFSGLVRSRQYWKKRRASRGFVAVDVLLCVAW